MLQFTEDTGGLFQKRGPHNVDLHDNFRFWSFRELRHLSLSSTTIIYSPREVELFSSFKNTLSKISLYHCLVAESALVTLIGYFPRLTSLSLHSISCEKGGKLTTHIPSLPLVKTLSAGDWTWDCEPMLLKLSNLGCTLMKFPSLKATQRLR